MPYLLRNATLDGPLMRLSSRSIADAGSCCCDDAAAVAPDGVVEADDAAAEACAVFFLRRRSRVVCGSGVEPSATSAAAGAAAATGAAVFALGLQTRWRSTREYTWQRAHSTCTHVYTFTQDRYMYMYAMRKRPSAQIEEAGT